MIRAAALAALLALAACGVKAPPRPPIDSTQPTGGPAAAPPEGAGR